MISPVFQNTAGSARYITALATSAPVPFTPSTGPAFFSTAVSAYSPLIGPTATPFTVILCLPKTVAILRISPPSPACAAALITFSPFTPVRPQMLSTTTTLPLSCSIMAGTVYFRTVCTPVMISSKYLCASSSGISFHTNAGGCAARQVTTRSAAPNSDRASRILTSISASS